MITITPDSDKETISTSKILSIIAEHASTTAILLLPGVQFYTGQFFEIPIITAAARKAGIFVIWDCAHAAGNVPLYLHDWDVDAAVWCNYKYMNAGPGAIGGLFVHERNGSPKSGSYPNRLSGWWGSDKATRFAMENKFETIPGAAGFQVSNPSILDITSLNASLEVFQKAGGMESLRKKSLQLTTYLESLLFALLTQLSIPPHEAPLFTIITPASPAERGAQLSIKLTPGLLVPVLHGLESAGVVIDERKPDVIRVAPAPLYNTFTEVWDFVNIFGEVLSKIKSST